MFSTKFRFMWPSGFRGKDFQKLTNQKQEMPMATMFVYGSKRNNLPQVHHTKFHLIWPNGFKEDFCNWSITNTNCQWLLYYVYDQHGIWKSCAGSPIHHSYKGTIHCAFYFQRRRFFILISANQKQKLLMATMVLSNQDEMRKSYRGFSVDDSCTNDFRGEDFQKLTNQKQELLMVAMFVNGSQRNEHS